MGNLADTYSDQGRWNEAEQLEVQVVEMRKKLWMKQSSCRFKLWRWGRSCLVQSIPTPSEAWEIWQVHTSKGLWVKRCPVTHVLHHLSFLFYYLHDSYPDCFRNMRLPVTFHLYYLYFISISLWSDMRPHCSFHTCIILTSYTCLLCFIHEDSGL